MMHEKVVVPSGLPTTVGQHIANEGVVEFTEILKAFPERNTLWVCQHLLGLKDEGCVVEERAGGKLYYYLVEQR